MKKFYLKILITFILLISLLFALSIITKAADNNVAKIGNIEYETLDAAIKEVPTDNTQTTITILRDVEGGSGFKVQAGQNIVIDFAGHSYDASKPTVGSTGTETNGCQLLKGSTVKMINGTLTSTDAKILIQNYCDLTLEDMIVDSTQSPSCDYTMSNNCGVVNIIGNTSIIGSKYAFDMCWAPKVGYPEGTQITVDTAGNIIGDIQLDVWGTFNDDGGIKSTLNIKNVNHQGKFEADARLANQLTIEGGTYTTKDVEKYIKDDCVVVTSSDTEYKVGLKATDLSIDENIEITIGDTKNIEAKVEPDNTVETIKYSSNNTEVATIDENGNIKAIKPGETKITVTVGNITKECTVKVIAKEISVEIPSAVGGNSNISLGVSQGSKIEIEELLKDEVINNPNVEQALIEGKDVNVEISVDALTSDTVSDEDTKLIADTVIDGNIAQYFDISVLLKVDNSEIAKLTNTAKSLKFELNIPEDLIKENREFYIIRVHDGKAEKIEGTMEGNKFIFETDKFSIYALAYTDLGEVNNPNNDEENNNVENNNEGNNSNTSNDGAENSSDVFDNNEDVNQSTDGNSAEKDETPKTGVVLYTGLAMFIIVVSVATIVVLKKRK